VKVALEVGEQLTTSILPGVPFQKFVGELIICSDRGYINDLNRGAKGMERSAFGVRNGIAI